MRLIKNSDLLLINVPMDCVLERREVVSRICSMPPLGSLYIASYVENAGYKVSYIDLSVELYDKKEFFQAIKMVNPKLVGITTYVESWNIQNELASKIKEQLKDVVIIAGGHCASFCYEKLLENGLFDYAVKGEGEEACKGLCDFIVKKDIKLEDIPNLIYNDGNSIIFNTEKRINDINSVPFPLRSVLDLEKYSYPFTISTARGCTGRCIFCSAHAFWGNKVAIRSPENILEEIESVYITYGLKDFFIVDDTFTLIPKRTLEFCNLLKEFMDKKSIEVNWGCESRADVVTNEMLKKMKDVGCQMIQFGMESGNNKILSSIKKNITYQQIYKAVEMAYEVGINTNVSFIIGHHKDTLETIDETLEKAVDLKRKFNANVLFSINTPYPGTELYERMNEFGIELLIDKYDHMGFDKVAIRTKNLSQNDIRRSFIKASELLSDI